MSTDKKEEQERLRAAERRVLVRLAAAQDRQIEAIKRKRSWRPSEKAMAITECIVNKDALYDILNRWYKGAS